MSVGWNFLLRPAFYKFRRPSFLSFLGGGLRERFISSSRRKKKCAETLRAAYHDFVADTRKRLLSLKRSSREWWKLARELMSLNAPRETIPPLKSGTGWAKSSTEKANLFSQTFLEKEQLEPEEINEYTEVERRDDPIMWNGFLPIRVRSVRKLL